MIRKRDWHKLAPLAAISLWAATVRLFAVLQPARIVWGDEPSYLWLGRNWLTGLGYSFTGYPDVHHSPGYPLLSGLVYLVTHNLELASDICYVLFGTLLIVPIYLLAKELYGRSVGYIAALFVATYPAISTAPALWGTFTEPPYYFFVYAGLLLVLLAMRRGKSLAFLLAGASMGFAYLIRPEAIAYLAVGAGILLLVWLFEKKLFTRQVWVGLGLYGLGFLVFFLPYAYFVFRQTGAWMVSEKAGVTFVTCIGLSEGDTAAFDRATWGLDSTGLEVFFFSRESYHVNMLDVIRAYPSEFVQLVMRNTRRFLGTLLSTPMLTIYLLPLMGVAFFRSAWSKARAKGELLLIASLTPVLVFVLFFIQDRYIATLLPALVIWLALGAYELGQWGSETARNLLGATAAAVANRLQRVLKVAPTVLLLVFMLALQPKVINLYANTGSF
ncbi:MAG TPA: glycosyltransferase family 39 protein, partial [Anaerolineae bacterium]|nr:glycosyltransferase family 39 protein [Anaerolineae bacterium]